MYMCMHMCMFIEQIVSLIYIYNHLHFNVFYTQIYFTQMSIYACFDNKRSWLKTYKNVSLFIFTILNTFTGRYWMLPFYIYGRQKVSNVKHYIHVLLNVWSQWNMFYHQVYYFGSPHGCQFNDIMSEAQIVSRIKLLTYQLYNTGCGISWFIV